ncbi:MAG: HAMP domain-containing sensor histidine kinase [bacterium]|nr:HAMP domain-containing sensor histidine kinase [bacterium]
MKKLIIRITAILVIVYLLFMVALSINMLNRDRVLFNTTINHEIQNYAETIWHYIEKNGMDDNFKGWIKKNVFAVNHNKDCEIALFDSEYNLLGCSGVDWTVNYNEATSEKNTYTTEQVFFDPLEYYSEAEVQEIEKLFFSRNDFPKKKGDFVQYSFNLSGWSDGLEFIPEQISVNKNVLIKKTDMGFTTESILTDKKFVNSNLPQNIVDMKYIDCAYLFDLPKYSITGMDYADQKEESRLLRSIATDKNRLEMNLSNSDVKETGNIYYRYIPFYGYADKLSGDKCPAYFAAAYKIHPWSMSGGSLLFLWISSFIVFLAAGIIIIYGIHKNEKKREELEEHRRYVTNSLAHDLKSPLAVISGYAESIGDSILPEKSAEYGAAIYRRAMDMDSIICSMLSLSQLENKKKVQLIRSEFELNAAVSEAADLYTDLLNKNNVHLNILGNTVINADRKLIMRVLDNMIINAVHHTPQNGEIKIKISEDRFSIYNSGSAINDGEENEIWKPFVRSDKSRGKSGSGLGLYIASVILDAHDFKYGCANTEGGVEFWFKM